MQKDLTNSSAKSQALNEFTDIEHLSQLAIFVRYVADNIVMVEELALADTAREVDIETILMLYLENILYRL